MDSLQDAFTKLKGADLINNCLRWQQHALLLHTLNTRYGLKLVALDENKINEPQEESKEDIIMTMPQDW